MTVSYPTLQSGQAVNASELNTNFSDAINATRGLTTVNLAANAGIVSGQLADRFSTLIVPLLLLPNSNNTFDLSAALTGWTMPNNSADPGTEQWRFYVTLRSGKAAYLCAISAYAQAIGATASPKIWFTKNGTLLGNGGLVVAAATTAYHLRNANPLDNPLTSVAHNDYFTIGLGHTGAAGASMRGLGVTFTFKVEGGA